uniref:Uncharacterized protein n=1 Tax=Leersia perrieri TaxID=77586 RepID=A0A0D9VX99_9ORYZ
MMSVAIRKSPLQGPETEDTRGGGASYGWTGEEFRVKKVVEVDEEAGERVREEIGHAQQAALVNEVAPWLADAAGHGEAARRETAEVSLVGVYMLHKLAHLLY